MQNDRIISLRTKIDEIDSELVSLIKNRLEITNEMVGLKTQSGRDILDSGREQIVLDTVMSQFENRVDKSIIEKIFKYLFSLSKTKQSYFPKFKSAGDKIYYAIKQKPIIIAGPCAVESEEQINSIADSLSTQGIKILRGGAFKPRTSPHSFQGLGHEGLELLNSAAKKRGMLVLSEILDSKQLDSSYDLIDIIQIGSRSMSSYGLLKEVGKKTAQDKKPILLKRGFSSTLREYLLSAQYLTEHGNENIILCLRGIRTFEQSDSKLRFTPDLASILELKELTVGNDYPIIFDPSHSTGNSKYINLTAKAALSLGADGLIIETHNQPESALSDKDQAILPEEISDIMDFANTLLS